MKTESVKDYLDNIPVYLPGRDREEPEHPAWGAWLEYSGHIPGTALGTSGRDNWSGFRAGWEAAADLARLPLERAKTLEEANHGQTAHFHEYRQALGKLGGAS